MQITAATPADLDRLCAIEAAAFDPARYHLMPRRQFRLHVASGRAVLMVARGEDGAAVGYALGLARRGSRYLRFYSLAVDPAVQRGRLGAALFQALEAAALGRGCRGVLLEIREDNAKLLERYAGLGYRPYRTVPDYYPDGAACIKMKRDFATSGEAP